LPLSVAAAISFWHAWLPLKKKPVYSPLQISTGGVGRTLTFVYIGLEIHF